MSAPYVKPCRFCNSPHPWCTGCMTHHAPPVAESFDVATCPQGRIYDPAQTKADLAREAVR